MGGRSKRKGKGAMEKWADMLRYEPRGESRYGISESTVLSAAWHARRAYGSWCASRILDYYSDENKGQADSMPA